MIRMLIGVGITLLGNALGLIVAAAVLDDMTLTVGALVVAVVIFTVVYALAQPFLTQMALSKAPALRGGVALIATLVALVVTTLLTDDLSISGALTWIEATVIVWIVSLLGAWLLPAILIKKKVEEKRA
ncbi:phage holin family protein [Nocardioides sp. YIM 152315]|uniref:phage holin family protein n=1 Tax=Nocardioides sp. YIM 152315 TaxID=3031760 RepID=UPI0023D9D056|nr:phage holin family protein [Nocardioides sp. YIM 152315]MDF1604168.1 phage holin family protein [Nocardioides sp. YIM 152315]